MAESTAQKSRPVSREDTTREKAEKPKAWRPPARLPTFDDVNPDYHHRWCRYEIRGQSEPATILARVREGYEPVRPEDVGLYDHPTIEDGRFEGTVISGDLMLMRIPKEMAEQRRAYYASLTRNMQRAVDNELAEEDSEMMPISKASKSETSTGRPHFRADDD